MFLRLLLTQIALAGFLAVSQATAVEEQTRGWGSAWTVPHSTEERVARERDDSLRDGHRAVQHARGASETLKHGSPIVLDTLAADEAEIGDFRAAVKDEKRALSLAKGDRSLYNQHLQSYMKANPVREAPEPPKTPASLKKS